MAGGVRVDRSVLTATSVPQLSSESAYFAEIASMAFSALPRRSSLIGAEPACSAAACWPSSLVM